MADLVVSLLLKAAGQQDVVTALKGVEAAAASAGQTSAKASQSAADATNAQSVALARLDAQLGLITKSDLAYVEAESRLNSLRKDGIITGAEYESRLSRLRSLNDDGAASADRLAHGSAGITRELIVLGHEAVSGNISRMPGSLMVLAQRMGGLTLSSLAVTAGVVAFGAALAAPIVHAINMESELRQLDASLKATGNSAQVTGEQLRQMADNVAGNSAFSRSDTLSAASAIASNNQIAPYVNIEKLTQAAADYAQVTGQELPQATQKLIQALSGGWDSLEKFNEQFPSFTAAEMENLRVMLQHGDVAGFLAKAVDGINQHFHDAAAGGLSDTAKAFHTLAVEWSNFMDAVAKSDTVQSVVKTLADAATGAAYLIGGPKALGPQRGLAVAQANVASAQAEFNHLSAEPKFGSLQAGMYGVTNEELQAAQDKLAKAKAVLAELQQTGQQLTTAGGSGTTLPVSGSASDSSAPNTPAKDPAAGRKQQILDDAAAEARAYALTGTAREQAIAKINNEKAARGDLAQAQLVNTKNQADAIVINAKHQAALGQLTDRIDQQVADSADLANAWAHGSSAGLVMEAQLKALTEARTVDQDATVNQDAINKQLAITLAQARTETEKYSASLSLQVDAKRKLAEASGQGVAAEQMAQLGIQADQAVEKQRQIAQAYADQTGDASQLVEVEKQRQDILDKLVQGHTYDLTKALNDELANQQDQLDLAKKELDSAGQSLDVRRNSVVVEQEIAKLRKMGITDLEDERAKRAIANAEQLAAIQAQAQEQQKAFEETQRAIKRTTDDTTNLVAQGLSEALQKPGDAWAKTLDGMHAAFRNTMAQIAAEAIARPIIQPIVASLYSNGVLSAVGADGQSIGAGGGGSTGSLGGLGSLLNMGRTAQSAYNLVGSGSLGSSIDSLGTSIGFGSSSVEGISAIGGTTEAPIAGADVAAGMVPADTALTGGASGSLFGTTTLGGAMGAAGGAMAAAGGGFMAGNLVGGWIGSPGGGALGGAGAGALAGAAIGSVVPIIGTIAGAIVGAIAGAIGGALGGQHQTVGPNANARWGNVNGVPGIVAAGADNGGDPSQASALLTSSVNALNSTVGLLGGKVTSGANIAMGYFKGKYFVDDTGAGGTAKYDSNQFTDPQAAIADFIVRALQDATITGLSKTEQTAISNLKNNSGMSTSDLSNYLGFAATFDDSLKAMNSGVQDFSKAATVTADQANQQLIQQLQNFRDMTTKTGLSLTDANAALKNYVTHMLEPVQQESAIQQQIDAVKAKFESFAQVLINVGYSSDEAGKMVKDGLVKYLDQIKAQVQKTFTDVILQATDPTQYQLAQIGTNAATWYADAKATGVDKSYVDQAVAIQEAQVYQQTFANAQKAYTDAIDAQISAINQQINATKNLVAAMTSLRQAANDNLTSSLSPLSQSAQLDTLKSQYDHARQAAFAGGLTPDQQATADQALQTAGQAYLKMAQSFFGGNSRYVEIFNQVEADYQALGGQQLDSLNQQNATLESQLTTLQGLKDAATLYGQKTDQNLTTLNQTMQSAYSLWQNELAAIQALSAKTGMGGATAGTSGQAGGVNTTPTNSAAIAGFYSDILGRAPDAAGLQYWTSLANAGTASLNQIQQAFYGSSEYKATHAAMRLGGIVGAYAEGGVVGNGLWDVDSVLARYATGGAIALAGGEHVTRAPAVNSNTLPVLNYINQTGSVPWAGADAVNAIRELNGNIVKLLSITEWVGRQAGTGAMAVRDEVAKGNSHLAETMAAQRRQAAAPRRAAG